MIKFRPAEAQRPRGYHASALCGRFSSVGLEVNDLRTRITVLCCMNNVLLALFFPGDLTKNALSVSNFHTGETSVFHCLFALMALGTPGTGLFWFLAIVVQFADGHQAAVDCSFTLVRPIDQLSSGCRRQLILIERLRFCFLESLSVMNFGLRLLGVARSCLTRKPFKVS